MIPLAEVPPDSLGHLTVQAFDGDTGVYLSFKSQFYDFRHEPAPKRLYADSARRFFERMVRDRPADAYYHQMLGFANALLDRKAEAIREGEQAVALLPVAKDAKDGPAFLNLMAQIYAKLGEPDAAIDRVEKLLSIPSGESIPLLRIDPVWDPLRGNPRFQRLVAGKQ
jgi:serine/threonine-protein kinase